MTGNKRNLDLADNKQVESLATGVAAGADCRRNGRTIDVKIWSHSDDGVTRATSAFA